MSACRRKSGGRCDRLTQIPRPLDSRPVSKNPLRRLTEQFALATMRPPFAPRLRRTAGRQARRPRRQARPADRGVVGDRRERRRGVRPPRRHRGRRRPPQGPAGRASGPDRRQRGHRDRDPLRSVRPGRRRRTGRRRRAASRRGGHPDQQRRPVDPPAAGRVAGTLARRRADDGPQLLLAAAADPRRSRPGCCSAATGTSSTWRPGGCSARRHRCSRCTTRRRPHCPRSAGSSKPNGRAKGVHSTTLYYPLVATPMIAPTKEYQGLPALTSREAAGWMITAARTRPVRIAPRMAFVARAHGHHRSRSGDQR